MKISKLILAWVLSGIVVNASAASVKLSCILDSIIYYDGSRGTLDNEEIIVEFDDSQLDNIYVTDYLYSSYPNSYKPKDAQILPSTISWANYNSKGEEDEYYNIDRRTGVIHFIEYNRDGIDNMEDRDYFGECVVAGTNTQF